MRRYARAVTGSTAFGDKAVASALMRLAKIEDEKSVDQADLYKAVDLELRENTVGTIARRALILYAVEELFDEQIAKILDIPTGQVGDLLTNAEYQIMSSLATDILIIEDEPLIAHEISSLCRELGHNILGIAATRDTALDVYKRGEPGLVLADVRLADGSTGPQALKAMDLPEETPVIFITAYPKDLLKGLEGEPTYLIPKPFSREHVKAIISLALMSRE
ncbi:MAG: response regulator [Pseudomonadota bacterium]